MNEDNESLEAIREKMHALRERIRTIDEEHRAYVNGWRRRLYLIEMKRRRLPWWKRFFT